MSTTGTRPSAPLPPAQYFMVLWSLPLQFGGMTTASLHRAGAFRRYGGIDAPIITFEAKPNYASTLQRLQEQGKVDPGTRVLNVFQYYREADLSGRKRPARVPSVPEDLGPTGLSEVVLDPSGALFMRETKRPDGSTVASRIFYREDGSQFLRDLSPLDDQGNGLGRYLQLLDRDGSVVGSWRSAGSFYRSWLSELAGTARTGFIVDSAFATAIVAPLQQENIIKLALMHNSHVAAGKDPFQGKIGQGRKSVVENTGSWDGIIFLTDSNRQDFQDRFGTSTNLFTVSNPSPRAPEVPPFAGRRRNRGVMVGRLEHQKNIPAAIEVMREVHRSLPDCSLDIYGTGDLRDEIQALIEELGLQEVVRLRGHTPAAAREFETARFSLLTSRNEGQGLVLMESMGRGCPPVSFDIRYGPRELIDDGATGYLVPAGDAAMAAERVVALCTDDELACRMGQAGWEAAERFSDQAIVQQWARVLDRIWQQQSARLVLSDLDFRLEEISFDAAGGLEVQGSVLWRQSAGPPAEQSLHANLVIGRRSQGKPLFIPAQTVERAPGRITVQSRASALELDEGVPEENNELDISLQVAGANILQTFRVGFPGPGPWRPYATVHGSLSLKTV